MADYCTVADVKSNMPDSPLSETTDTGYDVVIGSMIVAASRLIDNLCSGVTDYFSANAEQTRYYDGTGKDEIAIDECASITSVSVSSTGYRAASDYIAWVINTDYYTWPYNTTPVTRLIVEQNGGYSEFTDGRKTVKVVGKFGYSTTPPADVKLACQMQAMRWFMRAKQAFQTSGGSPDVPQSRYNGLDEDIKTILLHYQLRNL